MLPGSGLALCVREPSSEDELFTLETGLAPRLAVLELGRRVALAARGDAIDWDALPATDVEALALVLRRAWLGDVLSARADCPAPGCGEPIDIVFSLTAYLAHHRPRRARGAEPDGAPGWYRLTGAGPPVRFRVPLVADLRRALAEPSPLGSLTDRCVDAAVLTAGNAARVDRALAALSPPLTGEVGGDCPECGTAVSLAFDPCAFVLRELRDEFAPIYAETHLIAASYGWAEEAILRLPRRRRRRYADMAAAGGVAA